MKNELLVNAVVQAISWSRTPTCFQQVQQQAASLLIPLHIAVPLASEAQPVIKAAGITTLLLLQQRR
jgi:hypothetical protein